MMRVVPLFIQLLWRLLAVNYWKTAAIIEAAELVANTVEKSFKNVQIVQVFPSQVTQSRMPCKFFLWRLSIGSCLSGKFQTSVMEDGLNLLFKGICSTLCVICLVGRWSGVVLQMFFLMVRLAKVDIVVIKFCTTIIFWFRFLSCSLNRIHRDLVVCIFRWTQHTSFHSSDRPNSTCRETVVSDRQPLTAGSFELDRHQNQLGGETEPAFHRRIPRQVQGSARAGWQPITAAAATKLWIHSGNDNERSCHLSFPTRTRYIYLVRNTGSTILWNCGRPWQQHDSCENIRRRWVESAFV